MTYIESIGLGLVQALTEFLPVSSSGHLRLAREFFGVDLHGDLLFDLVLHLGTLVAVGVVYRQRIWELLRSIGEGLRGLKNGTRAALEASEALRYALLLCVALVPTGVLGLLISGLVKSDIYSAKVVGALLVVNGFLLYSLKFVPEREESTNSTRLSVHGIGIREAFLIGVVQGLAVVPGISRSGSTIVAALFLGAARPRAAEFSFFLSIPTILGALILESRHGLMTSEAMGAGHYALGMVISAVIGILALRLVLKVLNDANFYRFAPWCWAVGLIALIWGS